MERFVDNTAFKKQIGIPLLKKNMKPREEADRLAARLGNPLVDPHGDPIPSITGEIKREGIL